MSRAWIGDLDSDSYTAGLERSQVCIVGGGAAGCYLARQLAKRGMGVVLLEAGGRQSSSPADAGFFPDCRVDPYPGAIEGRAFGMGGSTARWGGLLVPHSRADRRNGTSGQDDVWKHIVQVANDRSRAVLDVLGFSKDPRFERFADDALGVATDALSRAGLAVSSSLYLPFRRKNLRFLIEASDFTNPVPRILLHAIAISWRVDSAGRIRSVRAVGAGRNGRSVEVHAEHFVIATGAVESARVLLELEEQIGGRGRLSQELGMGLGDHLSIGIADVEDADRKLAIRTFTPRFEGSWMRGFRFTREHPEENEPRAFLHFVFDNRDPGFELARTVLSDLQARRIPSPSLQEAFAGLAGASALAIDRYLRHRLHLPADTPIRLQLDVEQERVLENRVELGTQIDRHGRRAAAIDWRITRSDEANIEEIGTRVLSAWQGVREGLPPLRARQFDLESSKPHDAYHPVGVCRMGKDSDAVVDLDLRVKGLKNAWVASTSVLPTAGTANPTFTMLCLVETLAEELTRP